MVRRAVVCVLFAAIAIGQAPPGYKTWENKLARLTFFYPVAYQEVPLPPTEQVVVAKYVLKDRPAELKKVDDRLWKAFPTQLEVFHFEQAVPVTGAGAAAAEADKGPGTLREAMEAESRVASWAEFVQRLGQWRLDEDAKKPGHFHMTWTANWPSGAGTTPGGYLVRKQEGTSVYGVYGVTLVEGHKALVAQLQKVAGSLRLAEEDSGDAAAAAIDRLYASGRYRAVEWRKKARTELAKGWKALDTENYLIVHHSKNEGLIKRIARDIEAMRAFYGELFPPTGPMDRLSIVRVCRTRDEYHQYGGPPGTGGYWHPGNEELVFYDYSYTMKTLDDDERKAMGQRKLTDDDSLLVLYHEAFHQYIHYAIGEFSPHDWFNEGYGDYFSGAVVGESTGRVLRIDPSPWRIHLAKDMCEFGVGFIPLREILEAERAVFYHPSRVRHFYAGAWSFVFFLKHGKQVAAHPRWSRLLQDYFDGVKAAYASELAALGAEPDLGQKQVAGWKARKTALQQALADVDLPELERAWRQYVVDMKDPWPSKRDKPGKRK